MTSAKRRRATSANKQAAPTREVSPAAEPPPVSPPPKPGRVRVPDVPTAPADAPDPDEPVTTSVPAGTKAATELLGPKGEPIAQVAPTGDASEDSASPTETGEADHRKQGVTVQPPGRSRALHPLRVWPD